MALTANDLATALRAVARAGGQINDESDAISALADALDSGPARSLAEVVAALQVKSKKAVRTAKPAKPGLLSVPPSNEVVKQYLENLRDPEIANQARLRMGTDKSVTAVIAKEIAVRFLGFEQTIKTKKEAIDCVRDFIDRSKWDKDALAIIRGEVRP
jgi:hypothetical protein